MQNNLENLVGTSMENIKNMIDVNTIIGTPIETKSGVTIIPVSKVTVGFASGGSDFSGKNSSESKTNYPFGGGSGAGVTLSPIGFLVIDGASTRFLQVNEGSSAVERLVTMIPELIDKAELVIKTLTKKTDDEK